MSCPDRLIFPRVRSLCRAVVWGLLLHVSLNKVLAQSPVVHEPGSEAPLVTSIQQYWSLSLEQKAHPISFRIECEVTYYDNQWKILFVRDMNGDGAYVPSFKLQFPFKVGQRLVAEGQFIPPNADISFEHASIRAEGTSRVQPVPSAGMITDAPHLTSKYVTAEGLVDSFERTGPLHLALNLSIEGQPVRAWVLVSTDTPTPDLADANVRVEGVYNAKRGPDDKMSSLELMVPSLAQVTVLSRQADDPRFKLPVESIETLSKLSADRLVRVRGQAREQNPGHWLRIRDASGQVDVMTGQRRSCRVGEEVEAIGFPQRDGLRLQLTDGLFRVLSAQRAGSPAPDPTLRLAAQVIEMEPEKAKEGHPVWLTGVVTWSNKDAPFFFVEDSSGGVCVMRGNSSSALGVPGNRVEVHGATGMGRFAPVVVASRFDKVSDLMLPVDRPISLEHALTGSEEAKWVEMRGYLRGFAVKDGWKNLELVASAGDFVAVVPAGEDISALVGAVVVVHGVCTAETNEERKLVGIKLWLPSADFIEVEEAPPKDPFQVPARSLGSLGRFNSAQSFNRLLRVSGTVLNRSQGNFIQIENSGETLLVFSKGVVLLEPGDRIEAVGLLARQGARVTLRESICRKTGHGEQPAPLRITMGYTPVVELDGHLVTVEGTLIATSGTGLQYRLTLQGEKALFEAVIDQSAVGGIPLGISNGSRLSLTGVYTAQFDEYGKPYSHQLNLRSSADIAVLQRPSSLTRGRILAVAGALALGILLFIAWVAALRRQVRGQIEQIREQLKRESRLEADLQRAGRLESLGLLAGGIAHDFNNLLTVVIGNLSLARMDAKMEPESESSLRDAQNAASRAKDLTQQLLTFAKGGAPVQAAVLLQDVVREVAQFALRGSKVRCEFTIPEDLWPANVDKGQIAQVVQNIVINAMQAMPDGGVIEIAMRNERVREELAQVLAPGDYLLITFADHGSGIAPETLGRIFDPYFTTKTHGSGLGLATVHSIVKKHLGHISAESMPGEGTTFRIWLPAARVPTDKRDVPGRGVVKTDNAEQARILFMDDEEPIRELGGTILRRSGYDVSVASDGSEAVGLYERALREGRPYSLVILDLTIPGGMGGGPTLEALLKLDPKVKAIVSSGYSNDATLSNYRAYGFHGMVSKPYDGADLTLAVENVLKGGRA